MRTLAAAAAAIAVQPVLFFGRLVPDLLISPGPLYGGTFLLLCVVIVAALAVVVLGIPTFFLFRHFGIANSRALGAAGFLFGALPIAVLSWPSSHAGYSSSGNWHGMYVASYVDGTPTFYAWLIQAENVLFYGLHGLSAALVFSLVWRKLDAKKPA